jgi:hypothetical protein
MTNKELITVLQALTPEELNCYLPVLIERKEKQKIILHKTDCMNGIIIEHRLIIELVGKLSISKLSFKK